jgi:hypothetical protein
MALQLFALNSHPAAVNGTREQRMHRGARESKVGLKPDLHRPCRSDFIRRFYVF